MLAQPPVSVLKCIRTIRRLVGHLLNLATIFEAYNLVHRMFRRLLDGYRNTLDTVYHDCWLHDTATTARTTTHSQNMATWNMWSLNIIVSPSVKNDHHASTKRSTDCDHYQYQAHD